MLIFDYSQTCISALTPFFADIEKDPTDLENIGRHAILSLIKKYRNKFREYGDVVIACDGRKYWRREIFPNYKGTRKKSREESDLPWEDIHKVMDLVREELAEFSPYKVIHHPRAEADDIFGILVNEVSNKRLIMVGLEMDCQPTMMLTWDGDMKQLQTGTHIRQYSTKDDKFIRLDMKASEFLRRKILGGDSGDAICNVFSHENSLIDKIRQSPCTEKKMAPLLAEANMADGTDDVNIKKRIEMNTKLISFDHIPADLVQEIVNQYDQPAKGSKMKLYQYLGRKKCNRLMDDIDKF